MKKKILAFAASNSKHSINKKLVKYTANLIPDANVTLVDLNDFEMPIYSIDRENESGIHDLAYAFKREIKNADGVIISFAEHNGSYTTAFKNIFDWISRIGSNVWENKPMFLLSTTPGGHGGKSVLESASNRFKRSNTNTIVTFSLPSFGRNFLEDKGIIDPGLKEEFRSRLSDFESSLKQLK